MLKKYVYKMPSTASAFAGKTYTTYKPFVPTRDGEIVQTGKNRKGEVIFRNGDLENDALKNYLDHGEYTYDYIKKGNYLWYLDNKVETTFLRDCFWYGAGNFYAGRSTEDYYKYALDGKTPQTTKEAWTCLPMPVAVDGSMGDTIVLTSRYGTTTIASQGRMTLVYNLVPDTDYVCNVLKDGEVTDTCKFSTSGRVRMLKVGDLHNIRDIGDGVHIAYGRVIRGRCLDGAGSATVRTLADLGMDVVLDLRAGKNVPVSGMEYLKGTVYGMTDSKIYVNVCTNSTMQARLKLALEAIAERLSAGKGIYVHCTYGMDRTGILCAIIEAVCGCSLDRIVKDWEMSSLTYSGAYDDSAGTYHRIDSPKQLKYWLDYLHTTYKGDIGQQVRSWLYGFGVASSTLDTIKSALAV